MVNHNEPAVLVTSLRVESVLCGARKPKARWATDHHGRIAMPLGVARWSRLTQCGLPPFIAAQITTNRRPVGQLEGGMARLIASRRASRQTKGPLGSLREGDTT